MLTLEETPEKHSSHAPHGPGTSHCAGCGAGLRENKGACIYCGTRCKDISAPVGFISNQQPSEPEIPLSVPHNALCRGCGYSLAGLQVSDVCPECGRPVLESIRGDLLKFCDASYLKSLHRGVVLIQMGLILYLLATIATVGLGILGTAIGLGGNAGPVISVLGLFPIAASIAGWLIISIPDPGVNLEDKGDKPRRTLRTAALINTSAAVVAAVLGAIFPSSSTSTFGAVTATGNPIIDVVSTAVTIASLVAFVIQYFMAMKYLHWLAPRIPNFELAAKMKKQTWLIALLYFPGCIIGIGPLISLILFYNLLDKFRLDFKRIRLETTGMADLWKDLLSPRESQATDTIPPAQPPNAA